MREGWMEGWIDGDVAVRSFITVSVRERDGCGVFASLRSEQGGWMRRDQRAALRTTRRPQARAGSSTA